MALGLVFRVGVGSLVTRGYLRVFSAAVVMVGMMARIGSDIVGSWHYLKMQARVEEEYIRRRVKREPSN